MMGKIEFIHRVSEQHGEIERLHEVMVIENSGIEGDWRSKIGKQRQITLIEQSNLDAVAKELGIIIPPGVHRRQITTSGICLDELIGKIICIGNDVAVLIDGPCDPCKKMETAIGPGAKLALQKRGGVVGTVIFGGIIREGDDIEVGDL